MNTKNNVLICLAVIICLMSGVAAPKTDSSLADSSLQVSVLEFVFPIKPNGELSGKEWVERSFTYSYPVRFNNGEVLVLLGHFGWEGIAWSQLPTNALDAALKCYPNATKIRLYWHRRTQMGGQWNDYRATVLFDKPQGKIRFFTKGEGYYLDKIHPFTEFMELGKVTPSMIHEVARSYTSKRVDGFDKHLLTRGSYTIKQEKRPAEPE